MKVSFNRVTALFLSLMFIMYTPVLMADEARITAPESIQLDNKGKVELNGEQFTADKEVTLLFATADGVESDIGYALEPLPVVAKDGKWTTTWSYGRFVKKKLIAAGKFKLVAVDEDYNPIAEIMLNFK